MSKITPTNMYASIHQKLLNKAKAEKRPFNEILQYYAMERFLYRLSISSHANEFILKGGILFRLWDNNIFRPTMDIDMLGKFNNDFGTTANIVSDILRYNDIDDGIVFDLESLKAENITENAYYDGIRVKISSYLGSAKVIVQIDIGFGDKVYPNAKIEKLPPILKELPAAEVLCYPQETCIAEKIETILKLEDINSRMKDYYDIWYILNNFNLNEQNLMTAISKTLKQRNTNIPDFIIGLSDEFSLEKQNQWQAFKNKLSLNVSSNFTDITLSIKKHLVPILEKIKSMI